MFHHRLSTSLFQQSNDRLRARHVGPAAIAELSVRVAAPAEHVAVAAEGTAAVAARGDASVAGEGGHFDRDARDLGSGLAEGAAAVLAPAADGARGEGGAGVAGAGRQRDDGLQVARGDAGAPVTLDART